MEFDYDYDKDLYPELANSGLMPNALKDKSGNFVRGIKRSATGFLNDTKTAYGAVTGQDEYVQAGVLDSKVDAQRYRGDVENFTDISSVGDALDWATGQAGNAVGSVAPMLLGGGIGGAVAKGAARRVAKKALKNKIDRSLIGSTAGMLAVNYPQQLGETLGAIYDENGNIDEGLGVASLTSAAGAMLDALPVIGELNKFGLAGQAKKAVIESTLKNPTRLKRFTRSLLGTAGVEGSTEVAQEVLKMGALEYVNENKDRFTADDLTGLLNTFAAGAMGGVTFGTPGALKAAYQSNDPWFRAASEHRDRLKREAQADIEKGAVDDFDKKMDALEEIDQMAQERLKAQDQQVGVDSPELFADKVNAYRENPEAFDYYGADALDKIRRQALDDIETEANQLYQSGDKEGGLARMTEYEKLSGKGFVDSGADVIGGVDSTENSDKGSVTPTAIEQGLSGQVVAKGTDAGVGSDVGKIPDESRVKDRFREQYENKFIDGLSERAREQLNLKDVLEKARTTGRYDQYLKDEGIWKIEQDIHQLEYILSSLEEKIKKGGKSAYSAEPKLVKNWVLLNQARNSFSQWAKKNPLDYKKHSDHIDRIKKLQKGDRVETIYGNGTIRKRNDKSLSVALDNSRSSGSTVSIAFGAVKDILPSDKVEINQAEIDKAANQSAESPLNKLAKPSDAQKEAGNYKVGKLRLHGMDISIENPKGSVRTGTNRQGKRWSNKIKSHYGYIKGTVGADKDHLDVFLGDYANDANRDVYVVDQINPHNNTFDEHKIMLGYKDAEHAKKSYLENYDKGWKGLGALNRMSLDEFKAWIKSDKTKKPISWKGRSQPNNDKQLDSSPAIKKVQKTGGVGDSIILRPNGQPYPSKKAAVIAGNVRRNLKDKKLTPVKVDGGWGLLEESKSTGGSAIENMLAQARETNAGTEDYFNKVNQGIIDKVKNEAKRLGNSGGGALEGISSKDVSGDETAGRSKRKAGRSGREDVSGDSGSDSGGLQRSGSVGSGKGEVPVSTRGKRSGESGRANRSDGTDAGLNEDSQPKQPTGERSRSGDGRGLSAGVEGSNRGEPELKSPSKTNIVLKPKDLENLGGAKTKFKNNIRAIQVLKSLEQSGKKATLEEQKILAKYVGWGGIPQAFENNGKISKGWEREVKELKSALDDKEYQAAIQSTQNAHYTSPEIIKGIYQAIEQFGFKGGKLLEPALGVGHFFGLMPGALRSKTRMTGVELDSITGRIAKLLYPQAHVLVETGFQDFKVSDNTYDLAIGNPPFGSERVYDENKRHLNKFSIHNFFFAKSLDLLKPDGVLGMVVSNSLMDAANTKAREYLAERAELIGAIRLPNNAFLKNAGTEVTTDIIFLRKLREGEKSDKSWVDTGLIKDALGGDDIVINQYFIKNPDMMLGRMERSGSMYRGDMSALVAEKGQDTPKLLKQAIKKLKVKRVASSLQVETPPDLNNVDEKAIDAGDVRVGSMFIKDGDVYIRLPDEEDIVQSKKVEFKRKFKGKLVEDKKGLERVKGMIRIRDAFAELRKAQLDPDVSDTRLNVYRKKLNNRYDAFVKKHGPINHAVNKRLFIDDPTFPQISALEDSYDKGVSPAVAKRTGEKPRKPSAKKAAVFTRRTQRPVVEISSVASAKDAMVASLSQYGHIDLDYMQSVYKKQPEQIINELGDYVFLDPASDEYVTRDAYLSGNVKEKLRIAREANKDGSFNKNIKALEAVQPADIEAVDIDVKLGSGWLRNKDMSDFVAHITGDKSAKAVYSPVTASWEIKAVHADKGTKTVWGTDRMESVKIIQAIANQKAITVKDYFKNADGSTYSKINEKATLAAKEKEQKLRSEFARWIWSDDNRREQLTRIYNDTFNTDVLRVYDGSHLRFDGKISDDVIKLRPHQANGAWRMVQGGTHLLDHVVGAGKTFTAIAGIMEQKRMGLADKPMLLVPNHLVGQWAADFVKLYPSANILAATKKDFQKDNRKRLFARIATGDWDAVIVPHSSFKFIEVDPEYQSRFIESQVNEINYAISKLKEESGSKSLSLKQMAKQRDRLKERLQRLNDSGRKDDSLYWNELGIDSLVVDEAHEFKNLGFATSMQRVAGLGNPVGSQKAADLFMKSQALLERTGGRNLTFMTGTPISNTMAEMFTMQRYLDYDDLKSKNLVHFDAWAKQFGEVVSDWELSPAGKYKLNSRFSKFVNMPELMQKYLGFADVITRDDIQAQLKKIGSSLPIPKIKGGKPNNIIVERSADQAEYIGVPEIVDGKEVYPEGSLVYRSEHLPKGKPQKGDDNMLKIMSDARKAALDMRLIDPSYPDNPNSKVNVSADNIYRLYKQWDKDKGTQLVFIDLSTPKKSRGAEAKRLNDLIARADAGDEKAATELEKVTPDEIEALNSSFSVYDDLKDKLIARGIPENEIAFIHDANTDMQKDELFAKVRSGKVRVLLGSSAKMGAGMNVQERLVALTHLDAPWRPSDLEQREGRIIRQGNVLYERDPEHFEIEILRYATKNTLDSRMWQTIETKARFIEQVRKGNLKTREVEDIGAESANAAEMKAASSGNPLILEEMELRTEIRKLEGLEVEHEREQHRIKRALHDASLSIPANERLLEKYKAELKYSSKHASGKFTAKIKGKTFDKRVDAGNALIKQVRLLSDGKIDGGVVGSMAGYDISIESGRGVSVGSVIVSLSHADGLVHSTEVAHPEEASGSGLITRLNNLIKQIPVKIKDLESDIAESKRDIPKLEKQIREFPKIKELDKLNKRHLEIIQELKGKDDEEGDTDNSDSSVNDGNLSYAINEPVDEFSYETDKEKQTKADIRAREAAKRATWDSVRRGTLLANGVAKDFKKEGVTKLIGKKINSAKDLAELAQIYRSPEYETFRVFYVKGRKIVGQTGVTSRMPGSAKIFRDAEHKAAVFTSMRDDMKAMGADGYYLLHNHPSGDPSPSFADYNITDIFKKNVGGFKAHVVINHNTFAHINPDLEGTIVDHVFNTKTYDINKPKIFHHLLGEQINSPAMLFKIGKQLEGSENTVQLVATNKNGVMGILDLPVTSLTGFYDGAFLGKNKIKKLRLLADMRKFQRQVGGVSVFAVNVPTSLRALFDEGIKKGLLQDYYIRGDNTTVLNSGLVTVDRSVSVSNLGQNPKMVKEDEADYAYSDNPDDIFKDIDNADDKQGIERAKELTKKSWQWAKDKVYEFSKNGGLSFLTLRQLVEIGENIVPFSKVYLRRVEKMLTERNKMQDESAKLAMRWQKLDKVWRNRLAHVMHESTLAGVDPSYDDFQPSEVLISGGMNAVKRYLGQDVKGEYIADAVRVEANEENLKLLAKRKLEARKKLNRLVSNKDETAARRDMHILAVKEWKAMRNAVLRDKKKSKQFNELRRRFLALNEESQKIFVKARDMYISRSERTEEALVDSVRNSALSKKQVEAAMSLIRLEFESARLEGVYFPLFRRGDYFVRAEKLREGLTQKTYYKKGNSKIYEHTNKASGEVYYQIAGDDRKFKTYADAEEGALTWETKEKALASLHSRPDLLGENLIAVEYPTGGWVLKDNPYEHEFTMHNTAAEAERYKEQLERNPEYYNVKHGKLDKVETQSDFAVSGSFLGDVFNILNEGNVSEATKDAIYQTYLQTLPELSQRKHFIHRKKIAGFSENALQAFANNMGHQAHQISKLEAQDGLIEALEEVSKQAKEVTPENATTAGNIRDELKLRHDWIMNPSNSSWTNWTSSFGFFMYLGITPAAAIVNLTQTAIVAYPALAAEFGWKNAGRVMAETARLINARESIMGEDAIDHSLLNADERSAMQYWHDEGVIDKSQSHMLAGIGDSDSFQNSPTYQKWMGRTAHLFHKAEVVNREVTLLSAYRLARKKGMHHKVAIDKASELTWTSHFDYSNANRARIMQSDYAKLFLMFKSYSQHMLYYLLKNANDWGKGGSEGKKAQARLLGMLGMTFAFGGVSALPIGLVGATTAGAYSLQKFGVKRTLQGAVGIGALIALASLMWDDDEPFDWETEVRASLRELGGDALEAFVFRGAVNAVTGLDVSTRISLRDLLIRSPNRELEGRDLATHYVQQALGPVVGYGIGAGAAWQMFNEDHGYRAVEKMMPKFARDLMKTGRYGVEGVLNMRGDPIVEKDLISFYSNEINIWNLFWQLQGFNPEKVTRQYDKSADIKNYETYIKRRKKRILSRYFIAFKENDKQGMLEAIEAAKHWNKANPKAKPIDEKTLARSVKTRMRYSRQSLNGINIEKSFRYLVDELSLN